MAYNDHIREIMKRNNLRIKDIAIEMGRHDTTISAILRYPMTAEKEAEILAAIQRAAAKKKEGQSE